MTEIAVPDNERDMIVFLVQTGLLVAYRDVTALAVHKRVTEYDIAMIEKRVVDMTVATVKAAQEFETFELEKAVSAAASDIRKAFEENKKFRLRKK